MTRLSTFFFEESTVRNEDDMMHWERIAHEAINLAISEIEIDEVRGVVILPALRGALFHYHKAEFVTLAEMQNELIQIYIAQWNANVPFDGGQAVFDDDALDAVQYLLSENQEIEEFFDENAPPTNAVTLVTSNDLLENASASRLVRVSLDDINDELIRFLADNPAKMREMSPRKFEELVADMFRHKGYGVTLTPKSRDGGRDIIAVRKGGIGTAMIYIECKRFAEHRKVGVGIVRGLYGVVEEEKATQGIIATTSFFTRDARALRERIPYRLALLDFDALTQEIVEWKSRIGRKDYPRK
jgi:HJR/Mrr/RecB family endonuclease